MKLKEAREFLCGAHAGVDAMQLLEVARLLDDTLKVREMQLYILAPDEDDDCGYCGVYMYKVHKTPHNKDCVFADYKYGVLKSVKYQGRVIEDERDLPINRKE